jgi:prepilin-type N-terminal cleavage/methylation domain-containing protein
MGRGELAVAGGSRGLSLVELLVSLAIGAVLSFAVTHFLLGSKLSFLQSDELARLQENGAYALRLLTHELAMAGHLGNELPGSGIATALGGSDCFEFLLDTAAPLFHVNDVNANGAAASGGSAPPADCLLSRQHQAGTDILVVRRASGTALVAAGEVRGSADTDALYLRSGPEDTAAVLRRGAQAREAGDLWEYIPAIFFLRRYSRYPGDNVPALCRKRPGRTSGRMAPAECLVEGIENLQLEFGIDDDGDLQADRFERAPAPADLSRAVAARIFLLVRSIHPVPGHTDANSYLLAGNWIPAAGDGHYRRVMQATVLLRNNPVFRW